MRVAAFMKMTPYHNRMCSMHPVKLRQHTFMMAKGFGASKKPSFKYTGKITQGILGPTLEVPSSILRPDYAIDGVPKLKSKNQPWEVTPQTPEDILRMRIAGRIAREVLDAAVSFVKAGVTTTEIDALVHAETIRRNAYPSPLNYHGFPKSCCTSINVSMTTLSIHFSR